MLHLHRVALEKFENNKGIRIRSCLSSVMFPFYPKLIKMALYLYSIKLKVRSKYLYLTWCDFKHQVRKSSLILWCREETELCQKVVEKWVKLVAGRPGNVASWPLPKFPKHLLL
jgi:hypothetical protein